LTLSREFYTIKTSEGYEIWHKHELSAMLRSRVEPAGSQRNL